MTQKVKMVLGIALFLLLIAGAAAAYRILAERVKPDGNLDPAAGRNSVSETGDAGQSAPDSEPEPEQNLQKAPDFTVIDADGNSVKLSDMEGKPVVLNFWASWCPPCKSEMPEFDKVYQELGDAVQFMMVDLTDGQRETAEIGAAYVEEQGFTFPVYFDTGQEASYTYGIRSIPTTLFIDVDGYVVTGAQGMIDEETLRYGISLIQTPPDETGRESASG